MHRRLAYLLAWSVAAMVTVSAAWLGIRSVLIAAAPTRNVPLAAAQLRRIAPLVQPGSSAPSTGPSSAGTQSSKSTDSSAAASNPAAASAGSWTADGDGFRRTFHTIGGDVSFFTAKDVVQVTSFNPSAGYTVTPTRYGPDSVMVSFFDSRKTSRVWVRWRNGPYGEVTESVD